MIKHRSTVSRFTISLPTFSYYDVGLLLTFISRCEFVVLSSPLEHNQIFRLSDQIYFEPINDDQMFVNEHREYLIDRLYKAALKDKIGLRNSNCTRVISPPIEEQASTQPSKLLSPEKLSEILNAHHLQSERISSTFNKHESQWETSQRLRRSNSLYNHEPKTKFWWATLSWISKGDLVIFCMDEGISVNFEQPSENDQIENYAYATNERSDETTTLGPSDSIFHVNIIEQKDPEKISNHDKLFDFMKHENEIKRTQQNERTTLIEQGENLVHDIPGKMPRSDIGKFALEINYKTFKETKKWPSPREIIQKMQKIAEEPDHWLLIGKIPGGVQWSPNSARKNAKPYTLQSCRATLKAWRKSLKGQFPNI